ncbi:MAG: hypothetical protein HYY67_03850 [Thaumarchaeota archaeon]|nr:hypothetical protein [Nitrososphaerota archaeon]
MSGLWGKLSGRNGSIRRTKSVTVCRFCGKLLDRGRLARKFSVHGRTVYECIDHPFPREPEPKIIAEMGQNVASGIRLNLEKLSNVHIVSTLE